MENDNGIYIPPVVGIVAYQSGLVEVVRRGEPNSPPDWQGERGQISCLSFKSRTRMLATLTKTAIRFNSLLTLTWGKEYPLSGAKAKKALNTFLGWYRRNVGGEYFWFLEFQRRGAPHFHMFSQANKIGGGQRSVMAQAWARAMGLVWSDARPYCNIKDRSFSTLMADVYRVHAHPKSWEPIRSRHGAVGYCSKYALKTWQKDVPEEYSDVGRFWGASRKVKAMEVDSQFVAMTEEELREALAALDHQCAKWETVPKYLFGVR